MENQSQEPLSHSQAIRSRKRKKIMLCLMITLLLFLGCGYGYYEIYGQYYESTDDAYVQGNILNIAPKISGTVTKIYAEDGDYVQQGQPLVALDRNDTQIALEQAKANLANVIRQTRSLYTDVENYQSQVNIQQVAYQQAQADYQRRQQLVKKNAISVEELNHYKDALTSAKNALMAAKQALQSRAALTDGVAIADHPAIKQAIAQLQQAFLNNEYTIVPAPVSGYVSQRSVQLGEQVTPSHNLMALVPLNQVWVDANFKESQMKDMRIGQPVDITADLYGSNIHYQGHIASLGIGTGSAFSLLPAQNATGNWIKIVQRLPVRIELDAQNLDRYPLRIGLSMNVTVHLAHQQGPLLDETINQKPRLETRTYDHQLAQTRQIIASIFKLNGIKASKMMLTER
ncbi:efflux RND transporter periplasmic adaptor subunit [Celerinatantimonas sp. YJH-8]|uniref:efflux RND transporter periplasmic adaptor subunit n=1 Tax=Celerinatantimonas sp. YJH-8 TaxID=3228714 RepID=UPI0038C8529D